MIGIVDYGVGNIKAFFNLYQSLNLSVKIVRKIEDFNNVSKIILPGVGSFDYAMNKLQFSGMRQKLDELVSIEKMPVLGVCVGMQMLARSSEEGICAGLGWIDGSVKKIDASLLNEGQYLPHMGWNNIIIEKENKILRGLERNARFYFLHSYYFACDNYDDVLASCEYGEKFACVVNSNNIYGIQCHPEKSHNAGTLFLKNFGEM